MNSRQQTILQMVIDQGQVSVTDLAKATGVSEVTIRQDLNTLEKLSYLRRAHGFAGRLRRPLRRCRARSRHREIGRAHV